VTVAKAYGKYRLSDNAREVANGCDLLIGTTGRLRHLFSEKYARFGAMEVLVLDEADKLLDPETERDIREISLIPGFPKVWTKKK
jgi:superfamily II DNA/RNA helicase